MYIFVVQEWAKWQQYFILMCGISAHKPLLNSVLYVHWDDTEFGVVAFLANYCGRNRKPLSEFLPEMVSYFV